MIDEYIDARQELYTWCEDCDKEVLREESTGFETCVICDKCLEANYYQCKKCGLYFLKEEGACLSCEEESLRKESYNY